MKKLLVVLIFGLGILSGCSKDSTTDPYTPTCDGVTKSYSSDVKPLIESYCAGCHSNYSSYSQLSASRNSVRSMIVSGSMPRGNSLTASQKNAIVCWIDNGAPNN